MLVLLYVHKIFLMVQFNITRRTFMKAESLRNVNKYHSKLFLPTESLVFPGKDCYVKFDP